MVTQSGPLNKPALIGFSYGVVVESLWSEKKTAWVSPAVIVRELVCRMRSMWEKEVPDELTQSKKQVPRHLRHAGGHARGIWASLLGLLAQIVYVACPQLVPAEEAGEGDLDQSKICRGLGLKLEEILQDFERGMFDLTLMDEELWQAGQCTQKALCLWEEEEDESSGKAETELLRGAKRPFAGTERHLRFRKSSQFCFVLYCFVWPCCQYCTATGAVINKSKSEVNVSKNWQLNRELSDMYPVRKDKIKILGLIFENNSSGAQSWMAAINQVRKKIGGWSTRSLTMTGRVLITKSILFPILSNVGKIFPADRTTKKVVDHIIHRFIWGSKMERVKRATMSKADKKGGKGVPDVVQLTQSAGAHANYQEHPGPGQEETPAHIFWEGDVAGSVWLSVCVFLNRFADMTKMTAETVLTGLGCQ
ncbi:UNVERIFIED_CONTAM: hypothetical protein FKN15_001216 [Acipenser sinensis]